MKFRLLLLLIIYSCPIWLHAQTISEPLPPAKFKVELGAMPFLIGNKLSVGFSYNPSIKSEHVLKLQAAHFSPAQMLSIGAAYNYNRTVYQDERLRFYIPFWIKARPEITENNGWVVGEDLYPTHLLHLSGGTGLGWLFRLPCNHEIRTEGGVGAMFLRNYHSSRPTQGFLPTARLNIKYLIPLF